jgi:DNA-binding LytR/AlgR family response regulator
MKITGSIQRVVRQELVLRERGRQQKVCWHDIAWFHSSGYITILCLKCGNSISVGYPIKAVEEVLNARCFFRISRQAVVNMQFVKEVGRCKQALLVLLATGERITVSRRRAKSFLQAFNTWERNTEWIANSVEGAALNDSPPGDLEDRLSVARIVLADQ